MTQLKACLAGQELKKANHEICVGHLVDQTEDGKKRSNVQSARKGLKTNKSALSRVAS